MSRKKPGGGRVTPKGTQPAATPPKQPRPTGRQSFTERGGTDPLPGKGRSGGAPQGPTRSGHRRGNR